MIDFADTSGFLFQATALLVYRAKHGDLPAYVKGFKNLVEEYLPIERDEYHVFKINQMFKDVSSDIRG